MARVNPALTTPAAVLFDLDDTLSDHIGCVRAALTDTKARYPELFGDTPVELMERRHSEILEPLHLRLLAGEVTKDEGRILRTQDFFAGWGRTLSAEEAGEEYARFRVGYDNASGVVPGGYELLDALDAHSIRRAIITNNLVPEQNEKLYRLDLMHRFEAVVISDAVGVAKPDPRIFEITLDQMQLTPEDVVMFGNSLTSDIAGAVNAGIRAVWLDRLCEGTTNLPDEVRVIEGDLADTSACLNALLNWPASVPGSDPEPDPRAKNR